jgi:hypothetical protein
MDLPLYSTVKSETGCDKSLGDMDLPLYYAFWMIATNPKCEDISNRTKGKSISPSDLSHPVSHFTVLYNM